MTCSDTHPAFANSNIDMHFCEKRMECVKYCYYVSTNILVPISTLREASQKNLGGQFKFKNLLVYPQPHPMVIREARVSFMRN